MAEHDDLLVTMIQNLDGKVDDVGKQIGKTREELAAVKSTLERHEKGGCSEVRELKRAFGDHLDSHTARTGSFRFGLRTALSIAAVLIALASFTVTFMGCHSTPETTEQTENHGG